jgi:pilus assembly protein CpaC
MRDAIFTRFYRSGLASLALLLLVLPLFSATSERVTVLLGQSHIISFAEPIKRISIANPDLADATAVTPYQVLLNGKAAGVTSLVIWDEKESFIIYRLEVREEAVPQQILLKVRFAEVNESALKELGIDFWKKNLNIGGKSANFGLFGGKISTPSDPLQLSDAVDIFFSIPDMNFSSVLRALEEKNLLSVLAKPNLSATSGTEASFLAGGEFPIPIVSGTAGMQSVTIQFKEFGVRLRFLPRILDSTRVNIKLAAEVSSLDFENGIVLSGFRVPSLTTRKAETTVELEQGHHLVIGGLLSREMAKTISQIPLAGSIPILGNFFKSTRYLQKETDLLILVSPEIITSTSEAPLPEIKPLKM